MSEKKEDKAGKKNVVENSTFGDIGGGVHIGDKNIHQTFNLINAGTTKDKEQLGLFTTTATKFSEEQFKNRFDNRKRRVPLAYKMGEKFSGVENNNKGIEVLIDLFENQNDFDLLEILIDSFEVVNESRLNEYLREIENEIYLQWKLVPKSTHFISLCESSSSDKELTNSILEKIKNGLSSYQIPENQRKSNLVNRQFQKLKISNERNKWANNFRLFSIGESYKNISKSQVAVFFLPFIYDMNNVLRRINWYNSKLRERKVEQVEFKLISLCSMNADKEELVNSQIEFCIPKWLKKGISSNFSPSDIEEKRKVIIQIEKTLSQGRRSGKFYPFGFKESEALFAIDKYGVPKNVFPIFWCDINHTNIFKPFFK